MKHIVDVRRRGLANREFVFSIWALMISVVGAQDLTPAILTDGSRIAASLVEVADDWQITLKTNNGIRRLDASQLVRWGNIRDVNRGPWTVLASGSIVLGELTELSAEQIAIRSEAFGMITVARRNVRGTIWRPPFDPVERDRLLLRLLNEKRNEDVVWATNGDELAGEIVAAKKDGMPDREVTQLNVTPRGDSDAVVTDIGNVVALALRFEPKKDNAPIGQRLYGVFALKSGDVVYVSSLHTNGDRVELALIDGTTISAEREKLWSQISSIQMFHENVMYVSDLQDRVYKHIPFLSTNWSYGADRNVVGGRLRSGGDIYLKGIGMHSIARLACTLDGEYRRFEAEIAVDDASNGRGSVTFRVYAERSSDTDSTPTWQMLYESPIVRGGDTPLPIAVDVRKAKRLALVVDAADRGDEGDHAVWFNARLIR
jgi:hypothetical protein